MKTFTARTIHGDVEVPIKWAYKGFAIHHPINLDESWKWTDEQRKAFNKNICFSHVQSGLGFPCYFPSVSMALKGIREMLMIVERERFDRVPANNYNNRMRGQIIFFRGEKRKIKKVLSKYGKLTWYP